MFQNFLGQNRKCIRQNFRQDIHYQKLSVLFTAPQIPAGMTGFHRNPAESSAMGPESSGILRNGTGIYRTPTGIHRNGCIPAGMESYIYIILFILFIFNNLHLLFNLIVIYI